MARKRKGKKRVDAGFEDGRYRRRQLSQSSWTATARWARFAAECRGLPAIAPSVKVVRPGPLEEMCAQTQKSAPILTLFAFSSEKLAGGPPIEVGQCS